MIDRRIAATILLCAAASLPVASTPLFAQTRDGELGYVDTIGIHLTWGPRWEQARQRSDRELEKRQRDYERCLHPQSISGSDVLGLGIAIARGRNIDPRRIFGRSSLPRSPSRTDCGTPPAAPLPGSDVQIVDATASPSGHFTVLARAAFRNPDDNLVSGSAALGGRCVALLNASGQLVPVRDTRDPDPYGFSNPLAPDPVKTLEARVVQLTEMLAAAEAQSQSAQARLASSPTFNARSGQCLTPIARPAPPRPPSMSDGEIEDQAAGSCVDLMMRRHDPAKVLGALRSVRWDSMIGSAKRFQAHPAVCASGVQSQMNDVVIRMVCAYSDIACYGQMQTVIQQCMAVVRSSCGAPLQAWRRKVDEIAAEPGRARAACEATKRGVSTARQEIGDLQAKIEAAKAELAAARASRQPVRAIPLSQARCAG